MATLAIIAGRGSLPLDIAMAARASGHDVCLFSIRGQADADFSAYAHYEIDLGAMSKTRSLMVELGCDRLVMAGKVARPSLASLRPDTDALKLLGKSFRRGDDNLLRLVSQYFADAGIETISPDNFLPDRRLGSGVVVAGDVDENEARDDISLGLSVLANLGNLDVGQSVVVQQGRVIAIEAAEGTDAMIARVGEILDSSDTPGVLIKMPKQSQDIRLDKPVFGVDTVKAAAVAGIGVIALSAEGVLLADPLGDVIAACSRADITLVGIAVAAT